MLRISLAPHGRLRLPRQTLNWYLESHVFPRGVSSIPPHDTLEICQSWSVARNRQVETMTQTGFEDGTMAVQ